MSDKLTDLAHQIQNEIFEQTRQEFRQEERQ